MESSHRADFGNDQNWGERCKKDKQINWTNLADSMLRRFQAKRDKMGRPMEYKSIHIGTCYSYQPYNDVNKVSYSNENCNEILHRYNFFETYCIYGMYTIM